jgi:hypothetical protein
MGTEKTALLLIHEIEAAARTIDPALTLQFTVDTPRDPREAIFTVMAGTRILCKIHCNVGRSEPAEHGTGQVFIDDSPQLEEIWRIIDRAYRRMPEQPIAHAPIATHPSGPEGKYINAAKAAWDQYQHPLVHKAIEALAPKERDFVDQAVADLLASQKSIPADQQCWWHCGKDAGPVAGRIGKCSDYVKLNIIGDTKAKGLDVVGLHIVLNPALEKLYPAVIARNQALGNSDRQFVKVLPHPNKDLAVLWVQTIVPRPQANEITSQGESRPTVCTNVMVVPRTSHIVQNLGSQPGTASALLPFIMRNAIVAHGQGGEESGAKGKSYPVTPERIRQFMDMPYANDMGHRPGFTTYYINLLGSPPVMFESASATCRDAKPRTCSDLEDLPSVLVPRQRKKVVPRYENVRESRGFLRRAKIVWKQVGEGEVAMSWQELAEAIRSSIQDPENNLLFAGHEEFVHEKRP